MQPTITQPDATRRDERLQVRTWRRQQLRQAGFGPREAARLARHIEVDLHQAVGLVHHGCPPATALKILL